MIGCHNRGILWLTNENKTVKKPGKKVCKSNANLNYNCEADFQDKPKSSQNNFYMLFKILQDYIEVLLLLLLAAFPTIGLDIDPKMLKYRKYHLQC